MTKKGWFICLMLLMAATTAGAAEPALNRDHVLNASDWRWRINEDDLDRLLLFEPGAEKPAASYDLSGCMFCEGEDDNCDKDGIFEIPTREAGRPALAAVCHVGAHSQQLQIFAPLRDRSAPVFTVTGAYWVSYEITGDGITVAYDRRAADGGSVEMQENWR